MPYLIYLFFGILPSIIWLLFYLREDSNPESNKMIIKIFIYGMLATLPIICFWFLVEIFDSYENFLEIFSFSIYTQIAYIFIGIALVEEFLKYLVVKEKVLKNSEFDEPIDAMIYMIIAALGFAALENLLYLSPVLAAKESFSISETIFRSSLRFVGATFLHALCSGTLGYFLALSIYETKLEKNPEKCLCFSRFVKTRFINRKMLLFIGLISATFLHGLYNFSIMELRGTFSWLIPLSILISMAIFLTFAFQRLKKLKSTCKI